MNAQYYVCNLQLSQHLMRLGIKQESLLYWANTVGQTDQTCWRVEAKSEDAAMEYVAALNLSELGFYVSQISQQRIRQIMSESDELWEVICFDWWMLDINSMAKVLIHLIKKGFIKP